MAALLADINDFYVTGIQRKSQRSGWKIDWLNSGKNPFEGDEPGMDELIERVVLEKETFRVTDDFSVCKDADVILIDVQTPTNTERIPEYLSLRTVSAQAAQHLPTGQPRREQVGGGGGQAGVGQPPGQPAYDPALQILFQQGPAGLAQVPQAFGGQPVAGQPGRRVGPLGFGQVQ